MDPRRIALLCSEQPGRIDAIRSYSLLLADALRNEEGVSADVYLRTPSGNWRRADPGPSVSRKEIVRQLSGYDAVVLQYNPFMYGRRGFAPWLPLMLANLRRSRPRPVIALMVHEPYVPMINWRWMLMGLWQRAQLESIRISADVVFASIDPWAQMFRPRRPAKPTFHLPVGANLPDKRAARLHMRRQLGLPPKSLALAALGTANPSRYLDYIAAAANALAGMEIPVVLLNLGADAPHPSSLERGVRVYQPGPLSDEDLASCLATADIFLAPFIDGISTRRGSMMAALQHGLPIVGTVGPLTDRLLLEEARSLRLVPADRRAAFVEAVVDLARHPEERLAVGDAARSLYESTFDWPVLARRLLTALATTSRLEEAMSPWRSGSPS